MSTNLDRSLDEILSGRRTGRRGGKGGKNAPTSGVTKRSARVQQQTKAAAPAKPAAKTEAKSGNATKMIVSNLPYDITEAMLKEYFGEKIGHVKRATITYGPNGVSRGIATVEFSKAGDANIAFTKYHGNTVDGRPMKIEIVVDMTKRTDLADRMGAPKGKAAAAKPAPASAKAKPVTAANTGNNTKSARGTARRGGRGARRGGAATGSAPKKTKTSAELDAEMADYFTAPTGEGNENAAPVQAQGGSLDDDVAL